MTHLQSLEAERLRLSGGRATPLRLPALEAKNIGKIPIRGLGLTIVKKYVDLYCGAIAVPSEIQTGKNL